jgi:DNA invertase Pin-like site-specific DNA recombinase
VANALAELDAAGIRLYCDQERSILRDRVIAGLNRVRQQGKRLERPKVAPKVENAIRSHLRAGNGILKVASMRSSVAPR